MAKLSHLQKVPGKGKPEPTPEKPESETKVVKAQKEVETIFKKYNLTLGAEMDFPMYRELPVEVQLALKVIEKHGGVWITKLTEAITNKP